MDTVCLLQCLTKSCFPRNKSALKVWEELGKRLMNLYLVARVTPLECNLLLFNRDKEASFGNAQQDYVVQSIICDVRMSSTTRLNILTRGRLDGIM